jgi:hypothetical protein
MTAQAMDQVRWRGRTWSLVGIDGVGLFDPLGHGITPVMLHTAAWRGYICIYGVSDARLRLERLEIGFDPETNERAATGHPPVIGGATPVRKGTGHAWLYDGVDLPIEFSGGLRLGHGFIRELYVHMGFAPAWKFEEVHELRFEAGRLIATTEQSEEMRRQREEASREPLAPPRDSGVERITAWIRSTFDRGYRR